MKRSLYLLLFILFAGCKNNNTPDVSGIPVNIKIERFDNFLFRTIDTARLPQGLSLMQTQYPTFGNDFLVYILGLPPLTDSAWTIYPPLSAMGNTSTKGTYEELARFIRITKPLYDSLENKFNNLKDTEKELKQSFQFVKYYFPTYKVPKVITFIGPFDTPGVAITRDAMAIGLQLFAGKDFSFYTSTAGQELYPMYISRRFEQQYITPNCMKAVVEDMYPDNSPGRSLIEQMIEKGKRWWLLDKFLPDAPDSLKTDYTQDQLKWIDKNEGLIWNFILQGRDIYTTDPAIVKNFIGEAPSTNGMPEISPGNIGQWVGWQIVKAYADKNPSLTPDALMKTDAKNIFSGAKYKPK